MSTYILRLTLTTAGRSRMANDLQSMRRAESDVSNDRVEVLGLYGVLGDCDFVSIVEAPDNETVARFSLELGVATDAHIVTMPAIPISRLDDEAPPPSIAAEAPFDTLPRESSVTSSRATTS